MFAQARALIDLLAGAPATVVNLLPPSAKAAPPLALPGPSDDFILLKQKLDRIKLERQLVLVKHKEHAYKVNAAEAKWSKAKQISAKATHKAKWCHFKALQDDVAAKLTDHDKSIEELSATIAQTDAHVSALLSTTAVIPIAPIQKHGLLSPELLVAHDQVLRISYHIYIYIYIYIIHNLYIYI